MTEKEKNLRLAIFVLKEEINAREEKAYDLTKPYHFNGQLIAQHRKLVLYANKLERQAKVLKKLLLAKVYISGSFVSGQGSNYVTRIIHEGVKNYIEKSGVNEKLTFEENQDEFIGWDITKKFNCQDFEIPDWNSFIESLKKLKQMSFGTKLFIKNSDLED